LAGGRRRHTQNSRPLLPLTPRSPARLVDSLPRPSVGPSVSLPTTVARFLARAPPSERAATRRAPASLTALTPTHSPSTPPPLYALTNVGEEERRGRLRSFVRRRHVLIDMRPHSPCLPAEEGQSAEQSQSRGESKAPARSSPTLAASNNNSVSQARRRECMADDRVGLASIHRKDGNKGSFPTILKFVPLFALHDVRISFFMLESFCRIRSSRWKALLSPSAPL